MAIVKSTRHWGELRPIPNLSDRKVSEFWSRVKRGSHEECWPWQGHISGTGYGKFYVGRPHGYFAPHRLAYKLATNNEVGDLCILHSCDFRACCNPAHLRMGTYLDNNRDRMLKGRGGDRRGERSGRKAKLTNQKVLEIRALRASGEQLKPIAAKFGVTFSAIWSVVTRRSWANI